MELGADIAVTILLETAARQYRVYENRVAVGEKSSAARSLAEARVPVTLQVPSNHPGSGNRLPALWYVAIVSADPQPPITLFSEDVGDPQ